MLAMTEASVAELAADRARYFMGLGTDSELLAAVALGVDMFDCVVPTRLARNGSALTPDGRLSLRNAAARDEFGPIDPECPCAACAGFSRAYLRHLFQSGEILAHRLVSLHNITHLARLMDGARVGDPRWHASPSSGRSGMAGSARRPGRLDAQVFRITRFRLAVVLLVVVGAFFIDGYSLIYRYLVVHQPLGQTLTSAPTFLGRQLYIHKGLDLQGGTELTIEICHGLDNPNIDCRNGPPQWRDPRQQAQQATIPILDLRVNSLGVSEASVQAQGDDQILVQLPGVSLKQAVDTIGTTSRLYFATPGRRARHESSERGAHQRPAGALRPRPVRQHALLSDRLPLEDRQQPRRHRRQLGDGGHRLDDRRRSPSTSTSTRPARPSGRRSPPPPTPSISRTRPARSRRSRSSSTTTS